VGWGDSSKKFIAFVIAVFKAPGSSVGVGEGDGDNVGVGVGDGEGEGDGVGAGAVRRNSATPKRLHSRIITIAPTSVFFTAFSPSIIWLTSLFGEAQARAQQPCSLTLRIFALLLRLFPLKKLLQNRRIISQQAADSSVKSLSQRSPPFKTPQLLEHVLHAVQRLFPVLLIEVHQQTRLFAAYLDPNRKCICRKL
jgi:hypothetical protein